MKDFLYPASFFVKSSKSGIYTSTYPIVFPDKSRYPLPSFDGAINKWKFWHPNTKLLFTSNRYLSHFAVKQLYDQNSVKISVGDGARSNYEFEVVPITFVNNSVGGEKTYSSWGNGVLEEETPYYDAKIISFGTYERTLIYGEKTTIEFVEWWEEFGFENLEKYESHWEEIYNEPNTDIEDGDSWMDDPENYWNID